VSLVIALRDVRDDDCERIRAWRNSPHVAQYMFKDHYITPEEHVRWFRAAMQDPTSRHWIVCCEGHDLGMVNLYSIDAESRRCYGGIYIADLNAQRMGYGVFAEYELLKNTFDVLGLNKICGEVLAFNRRAIRLNEKFGFQQEGLLREHVRKGGELVDVVLFAMLRSEWELQRAGIEDMVERFAAWFEGTDTTT